MKCLKQNEKMKTKDTIIIKYKIMKQKFQINGISCGGCVARVKKTLEEHPNIEKAEIFLAPKGATIITMKEHISIEELQKQLNTLHGYTITKIN